MAWISTGQRIASTSYPLGKDSLDGHLGVIVEGQGSMTTNFFLNCSSRQTLAGNHLRSRRFRHTIRQLSALAAGVTLTVRTRCSLVGKWKRRQAQR